MCAGDDEAMKSVVNVMYEYNEDEAFRDMCRARDEVVAFEAYIKAENDRLESRNEELEGKNEQLKGKNEELEGKNEQLELENKQLKAELERLKQML